MKTIKHIRASLKPFLRRTLKAMMLSGLMFVRLPILIISRWQKNMELKGVLYTVIIHKIWIALHADCFINLIVCFWACSYAAASFFYSDSVIEGEKYKEIVNAIDCDKFAFNKEARDRIRKELNLEDKFVLGNVGRLHSQKNQSFLIDVFKEVLKKRKDAVLLIVGQGPEEKMLKGKVKELKLTKSVKFLGVRVDIPALFSAMDVFVFPSNYEGLGIVLIEAQASGLYCKASRFRIPEGAKLTELVDFISLDFGPRAWAERISKIDRNYERISRKDEITQKGFNIKTEAVKLTKFFED